MKKQEVKIKGEVYTVSASTELGLKNAILIGCNNGPTPPTDLIWNTTAVNWEVETTLWNA